MYIWVEGRDVEDFELELGVNDVIWMVWWVSTPI